MKRGNVTSIVITEEDSSKGETQTADGVYNVDNHEILNINSNDSDEIKGDCDFEENGQKNISRSEKVKENILLRYQERHGRQLYIRFPHKVPETQESLEEKVKELTSLMVKVHKPRQRHARFCLVDFNTKDDRDASFNELRMAIKMGELKKYVVSIPRTENSDFVNELVERKIQSIENKKAKRRLKNASKKSLKESKFTSTVIVSNLPKSASILQIRELFTGAVDINIRPGKGRLNIDKKIAAVTFPTTMDASNIVKRKLSLGGNQLITKFDNKKKQKKHVETNNNSEKVIENTELRNQQSKPIKKLKLEPVPKKKLKIESKSVKNLKFKSKPITKLNSESEPIKKLKLKSTNGKLGKNRSVHRQNSNKSMKDNKNVKSK